MTRMLPGELIGRIQLEGRWRNLFEDARGQYIVVDGEQVRGVWLIPREQTAEEYRPVMVDERDF